MTNTEFTTEELEGIHVTAALAMNGMLANSNRDYYGESARPLLVNEAYKIAEAVIRKGRDYVPQGKSDWKPFKVHEDQLDPTDGCSTIVEQP